LTGVATAAEAAVAHGRSRATQRAGGAGESRAAPAVSVVVRVVSAQTRVEETLASIEAQSLRDLEVVLVDGTEGRLVATVERWRRRLPLRHVELPRRACTRPAALNAGIAKSSGAAIAILDDDNLWDRDHLELLLATLEESGADLVYSGVRHATFAADGTPIACRDVNVEFRLDRLLLGNFVYATGTLYRRELWRRVGGYDERFRVFEDWELLIRAALAGKVVHLQRVSGTSRKFTGIDGVANFDLELADVRRCLAGVYWRHRRLYRGALRAELQVVAAEHCRRRVRPRTGLLAREVAGWRLELARDLVAWWVHSLLFRARRARGLGARA
jgi:glycosyltransferase involved in cell wall biosynthesis